MSDRTYPFALAAAGILVALLVVLPFRAVTVARPDGKEVRLLAPDRVSRISDAWDYLQLGRQIHRGKGLTSRFTYVPFLPESVGPEHETGAFPLLWRQPGYPLLVAAMFTLAGGPEPNAFLFLQGCWIVLLPLGVYALGRSVLRPGWAALAAVWTLCSPLVLAAREPVAATTAYTVWIAFTFAVALRGTGKRGALGLGLMAGLGAVLRFETWLLLPALAVAVWRSRSRGRAAALLLAAVVFVAATAPWAVRQARITGHAFYSTSSLLYHDTDPFPGWSSSRTLEVRDTTPLAFLTRHFASVARKTSRNFVRFARDLLLLPLPVLAPFAWLGFLGRKERLSPLIWGAAAAAGILVLALSPMEYMPRFLAPLVPLFSVAAASTLSRWRVARRFFAFGTTALAVGILAFALADRPRDGTTQSAFRDLATLVLRHGADAGGRVALSDAPTVYAWAWDRDAVWAPLPGDVSRVVDLLGEGRALITCTAGMGGVLSPDLISEYVAEGGEAKSPGCPALVVWDAKP